MTSTDHGEDSARPSIFPPGLIGDVAEFIYRAAPYQNATIALAGGIAFVAGVAGRAYNVDGAGLNQYVLMLAPTGAGKEAVADGIARIMGAVYAKQPSIMDYRGPGELVSAPGLIKWIDRLPNPVMFCIIGELGLMLKAMASPNANANMAGLQRVLLHLWSKSGQGKVFDASAYSDREKNTRAIANASLTIFGEGVPESFYSALDVGMITSGLLPRVLLFETCEPKPYRNRNRQSEPSPHLVDGMAALAAQCLTFAAANRAHNVGMDVAAAETFDRFERYATDQENGSKNDQTRGLWARLNLKAMKLAALVAVGRDPIKPTITDADCMWATNLVVDQTNALIGKFERGEVGEEAGNEEKQQGIVRKLILEFLTVREAERFQRYGLTPEMHRDGIITQSYLQRRTSQLPAFKDDRAAGGATRALHRTLSNMLEADELREMPKSQMRERYDVQPRAFAVTDPHRVFGVDMNRGRGV